MKLAEVDFEEVRVPLYVPDYKQELLKHSPAGRVPVLVFDDYDFSVWDSLSIMEFVLEHHPKTAVGWPKHSTDRAWARSISYEMHSGLLAVRDELPQNLKVKRQLLTEPKSNGVTPQCVTQIHRVDEIWKECLETHDGPWLFGERVCIADLMYIPVALRFVTYGLVDSLSAGGQQYVQTVESLPLVQEWKEAALAENESLDFIDNLVPASQSPLVL